MSWRLGAEKKIDMTCRPYPKETTHDIVTTHINLILMPYPNNANLVKAIAREKYSQKNFSKINFLEEFQRDFQQKIDDVSST